MMIGKGQNKKSMAYVGNIVALIKDRLEKKELGYHVFNYADKPDFSMVELTQTIEEKMKIKLPRLKYPIYWNDVWILVLILYQYCQEKSFLFHQFGFKNFVQQLNLIQIKFIVHLKPLYLLKKD